jgi:hypothetical protein
VNVVFAHTEVAAELLAARLCDGGPNDRTPVRRAPNFDQYATTEGDTATHEQFWDQGHTVQCWECDHTLSDEPCWRCAETLDDPDDQPMPVCHGGYVYCSDGCHQRQLAYFAEQRNKRLQRALP